MNMQMIVDDWNANAERHNDRNFAFLRSLKMKDDRAVDRAARQLHDEAFAIIDCTQCARCCKTVSPIFRKADIARIAKHLGMTATEFKATYLQADEDGDLCLKSLPCPFLSENGRCTVYEVRPRDCAEYPHTQKKGFSGRTHLHAGNAIHCPAVFWIVEQLRARHRWKPRAEKRGQSPFVRSTRRAVPANGDCPLFSLRKANKLVDLVEVLLAQHRAGRRLTDITLRLSTAPALKSVEDRKALAESMRLFIRMFNPHEAREDTVLFPAFRGIVSASKYGALGEDFERREHELFGKNGFEEIVGRVAAIEKSLGIFDLSQFTAHI